MKVGDLINCLHCMPWNEEVSVCIRIEDREPVYHLITAVSERTLCSASQEEKHTILYSKRIEYLSLAAPEKDTTNDQ